MAHGSKTECLQGGAMRRPVRQLIVLIFLLALLSMLTSCARTPEWKTDTLLAQKAISQHQYEKAHEHLEAAVKASYKVRGAKRLLAEELGRLAGQFANHKADASEPEEVAARLYVKQLAVIRQEDPVDSTMLARCLYNLGSVYWKQSEMTVRKNVPYVKNSLDAFEAMLANGDKPPGLDNMELGTAFMRLASCNNILGNYDEAIRYARKGISVVLPREGKYSPFVLSCSWVLADASRANGDYEEAENVLKNMIETIEGAPAESFDNREDHQRAYLLENYYRTLSKVYREMGRLDDEEKCVKRSREYGAASDRKS